MKNKNFPLHKLPSEEFFLISTIEASKAYRFINPHRHSFYEILWFTDAAKEESHWIDFEKYNIAPNQICILSPGQIHQMETGTQKGYVLALVPEFFDDIFECPAELFHNPYYYTEVLEDATINILQKITDLIIEEYNGKNRRAIIIAYLSAFFAHIYPFFEQKANMYSVYTVKTLKRIAEKYKDEKEVAFYANDIHLSIRRINEIVVHDTGLTVKQHIMGRVIAEAKRLIGGESSSFKEIAHQLGFNDPAYFSRFFKQKTGMSPEDFRDRSKTKA